MNALEAYDFIYNHPNCIDIDPDHPLIDMDEYEWEGIGTIGDPPDAPKWGAREGKKRDATFRRARRQKAYQGCWNGQFIHGLSFFYYQHEDGTICVGLETGPAMWEDYANAYIGNVHDTECDVYAPTFDEALILLAERIKERYGDYKNE